MKNLITILFVMIIVGCGKIEVKKLSEVERLEAESEKLKEELIRSNHEQVQ